MRVHCTFIQPDCIAVDLQQVWMVAASWLQLYPYSNKADYQCQQSQKVFSASSVQSTIGTKTLGNWKMSQLNYEETAFPSLQLQFWKESFKRKRNRLFKRVGACYDSESALKKFVSLWDDTKEFMANNYVSHVTCSWNDRCLCNVAQKHWTGLAKKVRFDLPSGKTIR